MKWLILVFLLLGCGDVDSSQEEDLDELHYNHRLVISCDQCHWDNDPAVLPENLCTYCH